MTTLNTHLPWSQTVPALKQDAMVPEKIPPDRSATAVPSTTETTAPQGLHTPANLSTLAMLGALGIKTTVPLQFEGHGPKVLPAVMWRDAGKTFDTDQLVSIVNFDISPQHEGEYPKITKAYVIQLLPPKNLYDPVGPLSASEKSRLVDRNATYLLKVVVKKSEQEPIHIFEGVYQSSSQKYKDAQPQLVELKEWIAPEERNGIKRLVREGEAASPELNHALRGRKLVAKPEPKTIGVLPGNMYEEMQKPHFPPPQLQGHPQEEATLTFFERSAMDPEFALSRWRSAPSGAATTANTKAKLAYLPGIPHRNVYSDVTGQAMLPHRNTEGNVIRFRDHINNADDYIALSVTYEPGAGGVQNYLALYNATNGGTEPELVGVYGPETMWEGDMIQTLTRVQGSSGYFGYPSTFEGWSVPWVNERDRPQKDVHRTFPTTLHPLGAIYRMKQQYDLARPQDFEADPLRVNWHTPWGTFESDVTFHGDAGATELTIRPTFNRDFGLSDGLSDGLSVEEFLAHNIPAPYSRLEEFLVAQAQRTPDKVVPYDGSLTLHVAPFDPNSFVETWAKELNFRLTEDPQDGEARDITELHPRVLQELKDMLFSPWTRVDIQPYPSIDYAPEHRTQITLPTNIQERIADYRQYVSTPSNLLKNIPDAFIPNEVRPKGLEHMVVPFILRDRDQGLLGMVYPGLTPEQDTHMVILDAAPDLLDNPDSQPIYYTATLDGDSGQLKRLFTQAVMEPSVQSPLFPDGADFIHQLGSDSLRFDYFPRHINNIYYSHSDYNAREEGRRKLETLLDQYIQRQPANEQYQKIYSFILPLDKTGDEDVQHGIQVNLNNSAPMGREPDIRRVDMNYVTSRFYTRPITLHASDFIVEVADRLLALQQEGLGEPDKTTPTAEAEFQ